MKNITENTNKPLLTAVFLMGIVMSMSLASASLLGDMNANAALSANTNAGIHGDAIAKARTSERVLSLGEVESDSDLEAGSDDDLNSDHIKRAGTDIDASVKKEARESTFAQVSIGQGWAILSNDSNVSANDGKFARIFWVEKTFVNNADTNSTTNATLNETSKIRGELKIGSNLYKLVLKSETDDKMVFDVRSERDKVNGTLELEAKTSLIGFTVWSGTLDMDSGQSYDIEVATMNSKVRGLGHTDFGANETNDSDSQAGLKGNLNAEAQGEGKKLGLFARLGGWVGRHRN